MYCRLTFWGGKVDTVPTREQRIRDILRNPPRTRYGSFGIYKFESLQLSAEGCYGEAGAGSTQNDVILHPKPF